MKGQKNYQNDRLIAASGSCLVGEQIRVSESYRYVFFPLSLIDQSVSVVCDRDARLLSQVRR